MLLLVYFEIYIDFLYIEKRGRTQFAYLCENVVISFAGRTQGVWIQIRVRMVFFCFDMDPYLRNVHGSGSGSRKINLYLNEFWEIW